MGNEINYKEGMLRTLIESMEDYEKELFLNLYAQDYKNELVCYVNSYWLKKFFGIFSSEKNRKAK